MKCAHCQAPKATFKWALQACANKRRHNKFVLCRPCDVELNRTVLQFFQHPNADKLIANYKKP